MFTFQLWIDNKWQGCAAKYAPVDVCNVLAVALMGTLSWVLVHFKGLVFLLQLHINSRGIFPNLTEWMLISQNFDSDFWVMTLGLPFHHFTHLLPQYFTTWLEPLSKVTFLCQTWFCYVLSGLTFTIDSVLYSTIKRLLGNLICYWRFSASFRCLQVFRSIPTFRNVKILLGNFTVSANMLNSHG